VICFPSGSEATSPGSECQKNVSNTKGPTARSDNIKNGIIHFKWYRISPSSNIDDNFASFDMGLHQVSRALYSNHQEKSVVSCVILYFLETSAEHSLGNTWITLLRLLNMHFEQIQPQYDVILHTRRPCKFGSIGGSLNRISCVTIHELLIAKG
jgi:hypothetical protein